MDTSVFPDNITEDDLDGIDLVVRMAVAWKEKGL